MANLTIDIISKDGKINSAYIDLPFDKAKTVLERENYKIISLEDMARLRIQEGVKSNISQNGNWVMEGCLSIPGKGSFITKYSPLMLDTEKVMSKLSLYKECYLNNSQVEIALGNSIQLSKGMGHTLNFGDSDIANFIFGKYAKEYGRFLAEEAGINSVPIWTLCREEKPFIRPIWISPIEEYSDSDINCLHWGLEDSVRGILENDPTKQIDEGLRYAIKKSAL